MQTTRDYVADAALGALTYKDSGEGFIFMAKEDLARIDAALTARASMTIPAPTDGWRFSRAWAKFTSAKHRGADDYEALRAALTDHTTKDDE